MYVASVIRHAMPMRHIVLSSLACPTLQYFLRYLINGTIFGKQIFEKYHIPNFMKIRSVEADFFFPPRGRKVRHGDANSRSSRFSESV